MLFLVGPLKLNINDSTISRSKRIPLSFKENIGVLFTAILKLLDFFLLQIWNISTGELLCSRKWENGVTALAVIQYSNFLYEFFFSFVETDFDSTWLLKESFYSQLILPSLDI